MDMQGKLFKKFYHLTRIVILLSTCINCGYSSEGVRNEVRCYPWPMAAIIGHTPITDEMIQLAENKRLYLLRDKLEKLKNNLVDVNMNELDAADNYNTCLHQAVLLEKKPLVKALIERGADVNSVNIKFETPLHFAVSKQNLDIVTLLLVVGANVTYKDGNLNTPLHLAIAHSYPQIVKSLLGYRANPNQPFNEQYFSDRSLLHVAVKNRDAVIIHLLVNAGADPYIPDRLGSTPLDEASECDKQLILETLQLRVVALNRRSGMEY
jgi:ankyrin repeat protein